MPEITIEDARLSFLWNETNLRLLTDSEAPFGFLGYDSDYAKMFDRINAGESPHKLGVPWEHPTKQHFWLFYVEGHAREDRLATLSGALAWKFMVPFRRRLPGKVTADGLQGGLFCEALFYPFGFGLIVTARVCNRLTLEKLVDVAYELRNKRCLKVERPGGAPEAFTLQELARQCMTDIRKEALGPNATPGRFSPANPFTVLTVVKGNDVNPDEPLVEGDTVHHALEALTNWPDQGMNAKPRLLKESKLNPYRANARDGELVYAGSRGRAVWVPGLFMPQEPDPLVVSRYHRKLSCYHRNLVFVSIQVESLCGLVNATVTDGIDLAHLPEKQRKCVRLVANVLGRMYGGNVELTYRSMSPQYHIEQNKWTGNIDNIRSQCGLSNLHKPP